MQASGETPQDVFANPANSMPFALDGQKCCLLERVDRTQPVIEFQTIDDRDRLIDEDVLRSHVSVSVRDLTSALPLQDQAGMFLQKHPLDEVDP
jgi:hypothetical protein